MNRNHRTLKALSLIIMLFLVGCRSIDQVENKFKNIPESPIKPTSRDTLELAGPERSSPTRAAHIIDDFEKGIRKWVANNSSRSIIHVYETESFHNGSSAIMIEYDVFHYKQLTINPDFAFIKIEKANPYHKYSGIEFKAKAQNNNTIKLILYEKNILNSNMEGLEIWQKKISLTPGWDTYRIAFNELTSEEYFEQEFIGDEIQQLDQIEAVGFYIGNDLELRNNKGVIWLDDIQLY